MKYRDIEIISDKNCPENTVYLMALSDQQIKEANRLGINVKKIDHKQIVMVKHGQ